MFFIIMASGETAKETANSLNSQLVEFKKNNPDSEVIDIKFIDVKIIDGKFIAVVPLVYNEKVK